MSTHPHSLFRRASRQQPLRLWDGAAVVFEPLSGDTHRIAAPAGSILALLAGSDLSKAAIESALKHEVPAEKVGEVLDLLLAMELVEPA